jgi:hypothetical protein
MQAEVAVCSNRAACAHTATSACAASFPRHGCMLTAYSEIYRIVSSKALDQGEGSQAVIPGDRTVLKISQSAEEGQKKGGCC